MWLELFSFLVSFSELEGGLNNDPRHPLVQQVKNNCSAYKMTIRGKDVYTQQATGLLRENANNDPQGLSSLFGSFGGGGGQQQGGLLAI
jgi:hypothetical protein